MNFLEDAIQIAVEAHGGQVDRSGRPYILHPLRVMHKVAKHNDDVITAAAVLHDVIEDCEERFVSQIEHYMPARVTFLVELMTHRGSGDESYFNYIERISSQPQGVIIKLADLTDNLFHPARRQGWIGHEKGKQRYLKAYFYLTCGHPMK